MTAAGHIKMYDGWWWPSSDQHCRLATLAEVNPAISWLKSLKPKLDCIIQAGGNTGVFPDRLSGLFGEVYTFEPDDTNYLCLDLNIHRNPNTNVWTFHAGLGDHSGYCQSVVMETQNVGAHRIEETDDGVPLIPIDNLEIRPDVIWLDVEGSEFSALKGAQDTIRRFHPIIIIEEKGLGRYFGEPPHAAWEMLNKMGYENLSHLGRDVAYHWRGK